MSRCFITKGDSYVISCYDLGGLGVHGIKTWTWLRNVEDTPGCVVVIHWGNHNETCTKAIAKFKLKSLKK